MLIRSSGLLAPGLYLCTLGDTCHYALSIPESKSPDRPFVLIDPGLSAQVPALVERLNSFQLRLENLGGIFLTHLHTDRISSIPYLRQLAPSLRVYGTSAMQRSLHDKSFANSIYADDLKWRERFNAPTSERLSEQDYLSKLTIDHIITESEQFDIDPHLSLRAIKAPGHTAESLAYSVHPHHFLITDEGFGYFRGSHLATPGGDLDMKQASASLEKMSSLDLAGLCLPEAGVVTGALTRKYLGAVVQNAADIAIEIEKARAQQLAEDHIAQSLYASFFTLESKDPVFQSCLQRSAHAIFKQMHLAPPKFREP